MTVSISRRARLADAALANQRNGVAPVLALDNETSSVILSIAREYLAANKRLSPHVVADLQDVARADTIANVLRRDAARLLEWEAA